MAAMTPTEKVYHLICPIRLDGGNEPQYVTGDIRELFENCRKIAEFPTIIRQLFMNGIMLRQTQILARTEWGLQPVFHKRKLLYAFAEAEAGVNVEEFRKI